MKKMKTDSVIRVLVLLLIVFIPFAVVACSTGSNSQTKNYYEGTKGLIMKYSDNTPPARMYYYGNPSGIAVNNVDRNAQDNSFDLNVELANDGANYAWGTLYFSGYNPSMLSIPPIDDAALAANQPSPYSGCRVSPSYEGKTWTVFLDCNVPGLGYIAGGGNDKYGYAGDVGGNLCTLTNVIASHLFGKKPCNEETTNIYGQSSFDCPAGQPCKYVMDIDFSKVTNIENVYYGKLAMLRYTDLFRKKGIMFPDDKLGYPFYLDGDNYNFPGGGKTFITSPSTIKAWPIGLDATDQPIIATACYIYSTHATPSVCIDKYPDDGQKKVCRPTTQSFKSQGAPISITKIEQENTPRKILFRIYVKNVGGGTVFDPLKIEKCNPWYSQRVIESDKNVIDLLWITLGTQKPGEFLYCTPPSRQIRLDATGQGMITCEYWMPNDVPSSGYKDNIIIEMAYGYAQQIQKTTHIKRVE